MERSFALLVAISLGATACSSGGESLSVGSAPVQTDASAAPTTTPDGVPGTVSVPSTEPGRPPMSTTEPVGQQGAGEVRPLSVDDALLDEQDVDGTWEFQHRTLDRIGDEIGGNQTDCDAYWEFERLVVHDGGETQWWQSGGGLTHHVFSSSGNVTEGLGPALVHAIVERCPVVNWLEGGTFTVGAVDLSVAGASAMQFRSDVGETTVVALLTRGDLISVVRLHRWPTAGAGQTTAAPDEFERIVRLAADRLAAARERTSGDEPPVIVTAPETDRPTIDVDPATTTTPDPDRVDAAAASRRDALLTTGELGDDWTFGEPERFETQPPEIDDCQGLVATDAISDLLEWEVSFEHADGIAGNQAIGVGGDAATVTALVETFAGIDECDLGDEGIAAGSAISGSMVVPGADAASRLQWTAEAGSLTIAVDLAVVAVDDHVMILGATFDGTTPSDEGLLDDLAARAVTRLSRVAPGRVE